jgi:polyphosphate glucokinase
MEILGIDIGGSGIKGAPVDTESGALLAARQRIPTPMPAKPRAVAEVVAKITKIFDWHGPVGCGFPAVIRGGVALTAANIHPRWIETNAEALFSETTGCPVRVLNDADAAGLAEMAFGAGRGRKGTVLIVTIGTGLGTAIFIDGLLVPNVEMGHIEIHGKDAEWGAADAARKREKLSWKKWSARFNEYLQTMERLIWPDLIILGGGVIKKMDKFVPRLNVRAEIVPAQLLNDAGIVGAALAAKSLVPENE